MNHPSDKPYLFPWLRCVKLCGLCGAKLWMREHTRPFTFWCERCDGPLPP